MITSGWQQWETHSSTRSKRVFSAGHASHWVFVLERASELAKEWKTPLCLAQLDLKKAFDHVQHSFATTALQQKVVSEQLISVLNKWWIQSNVEVSLAGVKSDKRITFQSRLQFSWRFRITSLGTWTMAGGTGTLVEIGQYSHHEHRKRGRHLFVGVKQKGPLDELCSLTECILDN